VTLSVCLSVNMITPEPSEIYHKIFTASSCDQQGRLTSKMDIQGYMSGALMSPLF